MFENKRLSSAGLQSQTTDAQELPVHLSPVSGCLLLHRSGLTSALHPILRYTTSSRMLLAIYPYKKSLKVTKSDLFHHQESKKVETLSDPFGRPGMALPVMDCVSSLLSINLLALK